MFQTHQDLLAALGTRASLSPSLHHSDNCHTAFRFLSSILFSVTLHFSLLAHFNFHSFTYWFLHSVNTYLPKCLIKDIILSACITAVNRVTALPTWRQPSRMGKGKKRSLLFQTRQKRKDKGNRIGESECHFVKPGQGSCLQQNEVWAETLRKLGNKLCR